MIIIFLLFSRFPKEIGMGTLEHRSEIDNKLAETPGTPKPGVKRAAYRKIGILSAFFIRKWKFFHFKIFHNFSPKAFYRVQKQSGKNIE